MYMYVCMYVCMYVRMYVCMYVRMYVCVVCTSLHLFVSFACAVDFFMDIVLYMIEYTMKV